jgi:hypothetical protein
MATRRSLGWVVREEDLGGNMIEFALAPGGRGYATVSSLGFVTSLVAFDRATGAALGTPHTSQGYHLGDLLVTPCGDLVVCDYNYENPGLRIFDAATGMPRTAIEQPVPTGLPPFDLLWIAGTE